MPLTLTAEIVLPSLTQPPAPALKSCFLLCPYCLPSTYPPQAAKAQTQPVSSLLQNTTDTKQLHITDFSEDVANESRQSYYNLGQEIISNATSDIIIPRSALAIPSMRDFSLIVSLLGTLRVPPNWRCPKRDQEIFHPSIWTELPLIKGQGLH